MPVFLPSLTPSPASRLSYDGTVFTGTEGQFPPGSATWLSPPAPFGPQVREQQDIGRDDATNPNFTLTTAQVGDTILLICANNFYTVADLLTPTGTAVTTWNLRHTLDGGSNDNHVKVWEGVCTTAGGTVVTNWTTAPPDEERYGAVWVFPSGISFDTAASTDADVSATSLVAPSVIPAGPDDLLICLFGSISGAINFSGFGTLIPYTERDVNAFVTYIAAREQLFSSAATGTRTITSSASGQWFAVSVLVKTTTGGGSTVNGTASIAGAGAVTASAVQGAGAALNGAGALSATVVQGASTSPTGAGILSAAGQVIVPGTASIAGAGTLTASAGGNVTGTATISGAGVLSATVVQQATSSPSGAGALTATAVQSASASPTGAGALSATVTQQATVSASGAGSLSANAGGNVPGTASIAGAGSVSAVVVQRAGASATGAGTVSASAVQQAGTSLTGAGVLSASVVQRATASPPGAGSLTASAAGSVNGTASLAGAGVLAATVVQRGAASASGAGALAAAGAIAGTASPSGAGALSASGQIIARGTATISGAGSLVASVGQTLAGSASIAGAGTVAASGRPKWVFRPNTGTTTRPDSGRIARPFTGVTPRP